MVILHQFFSEKKSLGDLGARSFGREQIGRTRPFLPQLGCSYVTSVTRKILPSCMCQSTATYTATWSMEYQCYLRICLAVCLGSTALGGRFYDTLPAFVLGASIGLKNDPLWNYEQYLVYTENIKGMATSLTANSSRLIFTKSRVPAFCCYSIWNRWRKLERIKFFSKQRNQVHHDVGWLNIISILNSMYFIVCLCCQYLRCLTYLTHSRCPAHSVGGNTHLVFSPSRQRHRWGNPGAG